MCENGTEYTAQKLPTAGAAFTSTPTEPLYCLDQVQLISMLLASSDFTSKMHFGMAHYVVFQKSCGNPKAGVRLSARALVSSHISDLAQTINVSYPTTLFIKGVRTKPILNFTWAEYAMLKNIILNAILDLGRSR